MSALVLSSVQGVSVASLIPRGGALISRSGPSNPLAKKSDNKPTDQSLYVSIGNLWYRIPQPFRYFVSGNIGNVCLYVSEKCVRTWMASMTHPPKNIDSMAYFTAYILHIAAQHAVHAFLVYGFESVSTQQKYWSTLLGTYQAYAFSAVGSTFLNSFLVKEGWNRDIAFIATLWIFSCLNYFWIGYVVKKAEEKAAKIAADEAKQDRKFVGRRKQGKVPFMRGGYRAFGLDELLHSFMTVPSAASP